MLSESSSTSLVSQRLGLSVRGDARMERQPGCHRRTVRALDPSMDLPKAASGVSVSALHVKCGG